MPLNIDFLQVLLHMLNFVILAGGLSLLLFKPISKFLDQRRVHFETLEAENARKAQENDQLKAEYEKRMEEANVEIADMKQKAEKEMARRRRKLHQQSQGQGLRLSAGGGNRGGRAQAAHSGFCPDGDRRTGDFRGSEAAERYGDSGTGSGAV